MIHNNYWSRRSRRCHSKKTARIVDGINKGVKRSNICVPRTDCKSQINNTYVDNAKYLDAVMPMYNLINYSVNYLKTSRSSWQHYRDEPGEVDNAAIIDYKTFKSKVNIIGKNPNNNNAITKDVEVAVPLKYLSNF